MGRPFIVGDRVLLVDSKRRRHLITLAEGSAFHSHAGVLEHYTLIGADEGVTVRTTMGAAWWQSAPPSPSTSSRCRAARR